MGVGWFVFWSTLISWFDETHVALWEIRDHSVQSCVAVGTNERGYFLSLRQLLQYFFEEQISFNFIFSTFFC
jgi:hypothetical protein